MNNGWNHVWQAMQMAKHTLMHEILLGCEVTIVVDMMRTVITIGSSGRAFRLRVVVEGYGEHHWHVHQHQQPRKPHSSIVVIAHHYPEYCFNITLRTIFFQNESIVLKERFKGIAIY